MPIDEEATAIAEAGFDGVWLDRFGYEGDLAQVEADLSAAFGPPVITDSTGRLALFDARPLRRRLVAQLGEDAVVQRGAIVTDPTLAHFGSDFGEIEQSAEGTFAWANGDSATLLVRSRDGSDRVRVHFAAGSAVDGNYVVHISAPGVSRDVPISTKGTIVDFELAVHGTAPRCT